MGGKKCGIELADSRTMKASAGENGSPVARRDNSGECARQLSAPKAGEAPGRKLGANNGHAII